MASHTSNIKGDVAFLDNHGPVNLAMPALTAVDGDFAIAGSSALVTAEFPALRTVRTWTIASNASLESLSGFPLVAQATAAEIDSNPVLKEILWTAAEIPWLRIVGNAQLEQIIGSESARISDTLSVIDNQSLRTIEGFEGIERIDALAIAGNQQLATLDGLQALRSAGDFGIARNAVLAGPTAWFPALNQVDDDFSIYANTALAPTIVTALLARVAVGGSTRVGDNQGQDTALVPCPWPEDGVCDADSGWQGIGTGLCVTDPEDCDASA
jgi:hypothetical protein